MTTLDGLRAEWSRVGRSAESKTALRTLRIASTNAGGDPLVPASCRDLSDLVGSLTISGGLSQLQRARIVALMLSCAEDRAIARALLQTMIPGVIARCRVLRWGGEADTAAFLGDALAELCVLIDKWAGVDRPFAGSDLLNALQCRLRRRIAKEQRAARSVGEIPDEALFELDRCADVDLALSIDTSTDLGRHVYAHAVIGHTLTDIADAAGVARATLWRRMRSASALDAVAGAIA